MKKKLWIFIAILTIFSCRQIDEIVNPVVKSEIKIETLAATNINQIKAEIGGKILSTSDEKIISYGFLINDKEKVDIANNIGNQSFEYTSNSALNSAFYNLKDNTKYYIVFYVKTEKNIYYGNIVNFITPKHDSPPNLDYVISTQEELISFAQNHYTYVYNLTIQGTVNDLSPLKDLVKVGADFIIQNTQLKNLKGLENITVTASDTTGSTLQIINNPLLNSLQGLDNVIYAKILQIFGNPQLPNLQGLGSLNYVPRKTYLDIPSLEGLPIKFETSEFYLSNFQGENIGDRSILVNAYDFGISNCPNLTSLKGFTIQNLQNTTSINISFCNSLKNLNGIVMPEIYDKIEIQDCPNFEDFTGLNNITTINDMYISNLPNLKSFNGFQNLSKISSRLSISKCGLTNFVGFDKLESINDLQITDCNSLLNFTGFSSLKNIGSPQKNGWLTVSNCANLKNLVGFENVNYFQRIILINLNSLENLHGLSVSQTKDFSLYNCQNFTNLDGIQKIISTTYLSLFNNPKLEYFCPIKNLIKNIDSNDFVLQNNLQNPTKDEIIANCP